jgi:hypothetical protein
LPLRVCHTDKHQNQHHNNEDFHTKPFLGLLIGLQPSLPWLFDAPTSIIREPSAASIGQVA